MAECNWLEVVQAVAVIVASVVAIFGINAWKREYVGKRRMELAEEVLAMFYEVKDVIHDIRAPFSFGGEGTTRVPGPDETPEKKKNLDQAYITIERYKRNAELFSRLFSARYRFIAAFGSDAGKPFYELNQRINELHTNAWFYGEHLSTPEWTLNTEERIQQHGEEGQRIRRVLFKLAGTEDSFGGKIDAIVADIDRTCRGVIEGQGSSWSQMRHRMVALFKGRRP